MTNKNQAPYSRKQFIYRTAAAAVVSFGVGGVGYHYAEKDLLTSQQPAAATGSGETDVQITTSYSRANLRAFHQLTQLIFERFEQTPDSNLRKCTGPANGDQGNNFFLNVMTPVSGGETIDLWYWSATSLAGKNNCGNIVADPATANGVQMDIYDPQSNSSSYGIVIEEGTMTQPSAKVFTGGFGSQHGNTTADYNQAPASSVAFNELIADAEILANRQPKQVLPSLPIPGNHS
jgi:hypothetical protein